VWTFAPQGIHEFSHPSLLQQSCIHGASSRVDSAPGKARNTPTLARLAKGRSIRAGREYPLMAAHGLRVWLLTVCVNVAGSVEWRSAPDLVQVADLHSSETRS
jgi:hypothetical protein